MLLVVALALATANSVDSRSLDKNEVPFLIPAGIPVEEDTYLCRAMWIGQQDREYIDAMIARTSPISHHMTVSVCEPGYPGFSDGSVWDCSVDRHSSNASVNHTSLPKGSTCSGEVITWLPGKEDIILPDGVAINLNRYSSGGLRPIVLEMHYARMGEHPDYAKVTNGHEGKMLRFVPSQLVQYESGLMLLEPSGGILPANSVTHVDVACRMPSDTMIYVYATGYHAHRLGTRVSGWRISPGGIWTLIGSSNDPMNQFFPSREVLPVQSGDVIASRCTYNNTKDHDVLIGDLLESEMCNFITLYYAEKGRFKDKLGCGSVGPPAYSWSTDPAVSHIPDYVLREA